MNDFTTQIQLLNAQYAGEGERMFYSLSAPSVYAAAIIVLLIIAIIIFTDLL
jgi:hypothetical protein